MEKIEIIATILFEDLTATEGNPRSWENMVFIFDRRFEENSIYIDNIINYIKTNNKYMHNARVIIDNIKEIANPADQFHIISAEIV